MPDQGRVHDQAARLREIAEKACASPSRRDPFVITVSSGKGGVGKSTIALNLAFLLHASGSKVLLFDGDLALGNIDIMLGAVPRFTVAQVLRDEMDIEDAVTSPVPGLALLSSGNTEDSNTMGVRELSRLVGRIRKMEEPADIVIMDTPAGLNSAIVHYSVLADLTLVVTTSEPTAIMDAYALIKAIARAKHDHPISVIMNAVRVPREGEEAMEKLSRAVSHFLKREISCAGSVPLDDHVSRSIMRQEPLVDAFPRSGASLSLAAIARRMMGTNSLSNISLERRPTAIA
jgi:flagellar biosynthesis protein FlhG